jgi:DNA polymerase-4
MSKLHFKERKIIHIDMDAFYPSVEQRDDPSLRHKPVIVGGDPKGRGVVASASYEARTYGVRSAMSCAMAYRLCPHAIFIYPNFSKYLAASRHLRQIFSEFTDLVEPLSLDEAYLDVTSNHRNEPLAGKIAILIKNRIFSELHLSASAGVGPNKFIAKLASDMKKPNGLVIVPPEQVLRVIDVLPVDKFWGVGPATARKLRAIGIQTAADIRSSSMQQLEQAVGSYAHFLFDLAHGLDDREVDNQFNPKSRGAELTFSKDIRNEDQLKSAIQTQAHELAEELKHLQRPGRTICLKIKFADFTLMTRSRTLLQQPTCFQNACKPNHGQFD